MDEVEQFRRNKHRKEIAILVALLLFFGYGFFAVFHCSLNTQSCIDSQAYTDHIIDAQK